MLNYLLSRDDVSQNSKLGFLASLANFYARNNALSENQYMALTKMYDSYSADHSEWRNSFDAEKKNNFKICVGFYSNSKYYGNIIAKVRKDENYIPTEKEYRAFCENKYATVLIREYNSPHLYPIGAMIRLRKRPELGAGNVLDYVPEMTSAVRGGKKYKVYFPMLSAATYVFEREIANIRDCDLRKMADEQSVSAQGE